MVGDEKDRFNTPYPSNIAILKGLPIEQHSMHRRPHEFFVTRSLVEKYTIVKHAGQAYHEEHHPDNNKYAKLIHLFPSFSPQYTPRGCPSQSLHLSGSSRQWVIQGQTALQHSIWKARKTAFFS